jgi:hypothetical protein
MLILARELIFDISGKKNYALFAEYKSVSFVGQSFGCHIEELQYLRPQKILNVCYTAKFWLALVRQSSLSHSSKLYIITLLLPFVLL